jgi:lipoprotein-releasing system permease protein
VLRLPFELSLALRYLRPKRTFVSTITVISIGGVMLGVAVLIVVLSVMTGFDQQLRQKILGFNAHLRVERIGEPMRDYRQLETLISSNALVKGVAPYVMGQTLLETHPDEGNGSVIAPVIRGVDPKAEATVSTLPKSIVEGEFDVRGHGIVIGQDLALRMGLHVGDSVAIYSIRDLKKMKESGRRNHATGEPDELYLPTEYEVRGIFDVGFFEFNDLFVICSLANAQDLYNLQDSVHGLMVMLHNAEQTQVAKRELGELLNPGIRIITWEEENEGLLDSLLVERNVMFYILFFIMIVAAFGITSTLITFVVQKTREIGLLKALGATSSQIMWLFLSQSLVVGILGVLLGLGLGILCVSYRNEFLFFMRRATGMEIFPARVYNFAELPARIDPKEILLICGGSLLICILAGVFPAWNAGRLKPVEALRHE